MPKKSTYVPPSKTVEMEERDPTPDEVASVAGAVGLTDQPAPPITPYRGDREDDQPDRPERPFVGTPIAAALPYRRYSCRAAPSLTHPKTPLRVIIRPLRRRQVGVFPRVNLRLHRRQPQVQSLHLLALLLLRPSP